MAFVRPGLPEIVDRLQQDFVQRLGISGALLRRSMVGVLSRVVGGAAHMLHGHADAVAREVFPDVAEGENLDRHAAVYGYARGAASYATGTVVVEGSNGITVPEGTRFLRGDSVVYVSDAAALIASGTASVSVVAESPGADSNAAALVSVSFESPLAEVNVSASVGDVGITGGVNAEGDSSLRARLLARIRNPSMGGAASDYHTWALAVPGVTRAWVVPLQLGAGTVVVRFVRDDDEDPIPGSGNIAEVQSYINARRPATCAVTVLAPTPKLWNFTLSVAPNTSAARAAVEAEIRDLFFVDGAPGVTVPIEDVRTAVGVGARSVGATYTLTSPTANLTHAVHELPMVGVLTWV